MFMGGRVICNNNLSCSEYANIKNVQRMWLRFFSKKYQKNYLFLLNIPSEHRRNLNHPKFLGCSEQSLSQYQLQRVILYLNKC